MKNIITAEWLEKDRLRILENKVLRKISGSRERESSRRNKKTNEKYHNFYSLLRKNDMGGIQHAWRK